MNGVIFVALSSRHHLLLRLPRHRVIELTIAGQGKELKRRGRSMHEWLVVYEQSEGGLLLLMHEALSFVESLC
jgi:hypothetical protein